MCRRYTVKVSLETLLQRFPFAGLGRVGLDQEGLVPRFNIAPKQFAPVVADTGEGPAIQPMHWWLIAPWSPDGKPGEFSTYNARDDRMMDSKMFGPLARSKRCIVPVSGFYEWKKSGRDSGPRYIQPPDDRILALAGLWYRWRSKKDDSELLSFAIVTTAPNETVRPIHNRMPAILRKDDEERWLDPSINEPEEIRSMIASYDGSLTAHSVSSEVDDESIDDIRLTQSTETGELF